MLAFYYTVLLFAESGGSGGGFSRFFHDYLSIPGFEIWKFVNLAIFIALIYYFARKYKLPDAFKEKRNAIRAELMRAEEAKKAALERLTAAEARLAQLESERESILTKAKEEAEAERKRLTEQTRAEMARMREQAAAEISRIIHLKNAELRRLSAEESIRLAEQKLRSQIGPENDARLVKASISEIGGLN
jgi:F0F1-type ATP synthase membrane subunit b/b'